MSPQPSDWDPQAAVREVRESVQVMLRQHDETGVDPEGRLFIRSGSSRLYLEFVPQDEMQVVYLTLTCPVARAVPITPDLLQYLASAADLWYFGHLAMSAESADPADAGDAQTVSTVSVYFAHTIVGGGLDFVQLSTPVIAMLTTVEAIAADFIQEFGGTTWSAI